jgi:signal transduction histidine kinase
MTIRGQITIIILVALLTIISMGNAVERWAREDLAAPDLESIANRLSAIAEILGPASPEARQVILANARRAGWDIELAPTATGNRFTRFSSHQGFLDIAAAWLFPPDNEPPLGGWQTFLNDRRVIAAQVDDDTIVISSGFPDSMLKSAFLGPIPYYFVAFFVLIGFFFIFAIRAITEPIQRIAHAAAVSDITTGSPVFEERGTVEIVALARALNGMRRRIRLMIEARTRMLRGIGHDLRTPLTRLKLRVERMGESGQKEALLSDIDRIESLLVESLNYLRNDYATETIELVDVASILQTVCSEFADIGHAVQYTGPNRLLARCRPLSITRAVSNLCDNAVKFADNIDVTMAERPETVLIVVEDDGPGIPQELRERVLEPFFKSDQSRAGGGFGLGLSIVADIVHSHQGILELRQRNPRGLSVVVEIPK